jgi:phospholipid/cholesterol/gamma-HCH transport system substrate-binding protein
MLLERNLVRIGAIAAIVIAAGTLFALLMTRGLFERGHEIHAVFSDAAGLAVDDDVLVAGVRSGRVTAVEINNGAAEVTFIVAEDLPRDTRARIMVQNLLGRRQLHLVAGGDWTELLRDGDTIPMERTSTPVDVPEFSEEQELLAREIDEEALQAIVTALADITEGQREQVDDLLDGVGRVATVVADRREELRDTIDGTERFFRAFRDRDDEIVRIIDAFGSTLDLLADRRADVQQVIRGTADASEALTGLVVAERARIDRVLGRLHEDLRIVDRNQVDIAHFFAYSGVALKGFASVGYASPDESEDTPYWANMHADTVGTVGPDPLFGCGGAFDRLLDETIGEDPRTCEEQDPQTENDGARRSSLSAFFRLHPVHLELVEQGVRQ